MFARPFGATDAPPDASRGLHQLAHLWDFPAEHFVVPGDQSVPDLVETQQQVLDLEH